jgi:xanthine dehydrogenase accessory factor
VKPPENAASRRSSICSSGAHTTDRRHRSRRAVGGGREHDGERRRALTAGRSDEEALAACLGKGLRFLGLLASRPKFVHIAAALEERGVSLEELSTIHSPLGLQLGAVTPEEIAVSILAEMIAVRRGIAAEGVKSLKMELPGRFKAVR